MVKLKKNKYNRVLFGVCSGIADYLNIDTTLIRIIFVIGTFLTGSLLLWLYLLLAIILPPEWEFFKFGCWQADKGWYNRRVEARGSVAWLTRKDGWLFKIWRLIMAEVTNIEKQSRVRCSDEQFLEAVYSSKTYAEIATKTGQKVASTMARFARTKAALAKKGIELPSMERAKPTKTVDNVEAMAEIVRRLKAHNNGWERIV
jgi:phage shock protein PspC (stress-responsive transcriptional regulator)